MLECLQRKWDKGTIQEHRVVIPRKRCAWMKSGFLLCHLHLGRHGLHEGRELSGFKSWLEQFSGWLCLIHDAYGPELKEAISSVLPIRQFRNHDQNMRSKRLFHLLQQNFSGYSKIENLIKSQISAVGITESNGFELLRVIRKEFSLLSRSEALGYREQCVKFRVKKTDHLPDVMREVQTEIDSFHSMLEASVIAVELHDVRISEGDQFLLYMRNLPSKVQEFLQLHQNC